MVKHIRAQYMFETKGEILKCYLKNGKGVFKVYSTLKESTLRTFKSRFIKLYYKIKNIQVNKKRENITEEIINSD